MGRFDGLALINAVTDLAELLGKRTTIEEFLDNLVSSVSMHLESDVCSIYLYDVEDRMLVLRATRGLNRGLVGEVRLAPGEGLTGLAFQENRAILETDVTHSRRNKSVPDLGEEDYPSFLAVPIKRSDLGVGVLTLQHSTSDHIDDTVIRALRAIASHLAMTLENAAALYELADHRSRPGSARDDEAYRSGLIHGQSASRGLAIGRVITFADHQAVVTDDVDGDLTGAIERSIHQLQELQRRVDESHSDVAALIFSSHLLMLQDDSFVGAIVRLWNEGTAPIAAVESVVDEYCARFEAIPDPRFQEKAQDVRDLGHRIVRNLGQADDQESDYRGSVAILSEIYPSELVKLYLQRVEAIVYSGGAATGHVAILAQSLGLPLVSAADPAVLRIPSQTRIVVDAEDGKVVVDPPTEVLSAYRARIRGLERRQAVARNRRLPVEVLTADGVRVRVLANVNLVKDARAARGRGAGGIGLYRSEFPFLIRNGFPTEDEQFAVYQRVIETMPIGPVSLRTLDLGGDKLLSAQVGKEENPFLGFRGIRFLLKHRDILRDQIRAMLRAGENHDLGIQFPMISGMEEFLEAQAEVHRAIHELGREGTPHNSSPRIGAMIEVPAAVELAGQLARHADFLSLGTNDLAMYVLAADRGNHRVADIYRGLHPAVMRVIARLAESAPSEMLSVCGSSVSDPAMTVFLLGCGIRTLSVAPEDLVPLGDVVSAVTIREAKATTRAMLAAETLEDLAAQARDLRARFEPEEFAEE